MKKSYNFRFFQGHCPGTIFYHQEAQEKTSPGTSPVHPNDRKTIYNDLMQVSGR